MFDEFVALRDKYDAQKERLNTAIWEYIPTAEGPLNSIPAIQPAGQVDSLQEDQDSVGDYIFGASLGEGQFAKVRACTKSNAGHMSRLNVRGDYKQSERSSMTNLSSSMNNTQFTSSATTNNNKEYTGEAKEMLTPTNSTHAIPTNDHDDHDDHAAATANFTTSTSASASATTTPKHGKAKPRRLRRTNSVMGFSDVERSKTRYDLAVKIIQKNKMQEARDIYRLNSEIANLKLLNHPNVVELMNVIHTSKYLYLFTNRGGDDLFEWLNNKRNMQRQQDGGGDLILKKKTITSIMTQLISGVSALHANGICHRDLKPENILLDIHEHLLIVDFGLCEKISVANGDQQPRLLSDFCGR